MRPAVADDAVGAALALEATGGGEIGQVRQALAHGEAHLMHVELTAEQDRHDLGRGLGPVARVDDLGQAQLVMTDELVEGRNLYHAIRWYKC